MIAVIDSYTSASESITCSLSCHYIRHMMLEHRQAGDTLKGVSTLEEEEPDNEFHEEDERETQPAHQQTAPEPVCAQPAGGQAMDVEKC